MHSIYIHLKTGGKLVVAVITASINGLAAGTVEAFESFNEQYKDIVTQHSIELSQVKLDKNDEV